MSVKSWDRRERFWRWLVALSSRQLKHATEQRRLAQRHAYLRRRALDRAAVMNRVVQYVKSVDDDEDEFFG